MGSRDEKDKTKVRKEKLAGYFFNLSQLTFTGTGVGGIAPILQGEFGVKNIICSNYIWYSNDLHFCGHC